MRWSEQLPQKGDMIRVKVKFYYHYGIYADDSTVIQFGLPDNTGIEPEEIAVLVTDMDGFRLGGSPETAVLERSERSRSRKPQAVVDYALSQVGRKGYHILQNNCEHFVHECVFGTADSPQVQSIREKLRAKLGKR